MPDRPLIDIENYGEIRRAIRQADADIKKKVRDFDKEIAAAVAEYAPEFTPEKTGALKRSIKSGADGKGGWVGAGSASRVAYAPVVHWGWPARNIPRSGYIIRGLAKAGRELGKGDLTNYYLEGLNEIFDQMSNTMNG